MQPHLMMLLADQRAADMHRRAERSRRAREIPGRPGRRFGFRPWLAPRPRRAHADPSAAR